MAKAEENEEMDFLNRLPYPTDASIRMRRRWEFQACGAGEQGNGGELK
jgi:hypothetical protein